MYAPFSAANPVAGTFTILSASAGALTAANDYLTKAGGNTSTAVYLDARNAGQDQITKSVPEPGSMLLMGAGALVAGLFKRRREGLNEMSA